MEMEKKKKKGGMLCPVHKHLWSSDHFLGTLKFLHTVSVSSSDSLIIGFRCMFYKWDQLLN